MVYYPHRRHRPSSGLLGAGHVQVFVDLWAASEDSAILEADGYLDGWATLRVVNPDAQKIYFLAADPYISKHLARKAFPRPTRSRKKTVYRLGHDALVSMSTPGFAFGRTPGGTALP